MSKKRRDKDNSRLHTFSKENIEELADARIITKNLVYVIGLSSALADMEKLSKYEYFGQYGKIIKIVVNKTKAYNKDSPNGPSYSAYVTFSTPSEASVAILALDGVCVDNHNIRASFGTTKYCSFFLKGIECNNKDCVFLHEIAENSEIIKRGELTPVRFAEQHTFAIKIADIYKPEVKKRLQQPPKIKTVFPSSDMIYRADWLEGRARRRREKFEKYEEEFYDDVEDEEEYYLESEDREKNGRAPRGEFREFREFKEVGESLEKKNKGSKGSKEKGNSAGGGREKEGKSMDRKGRELFLSRDTSRFSFTKNSNKPNPVVVPKYILTLISKKINLHNLTRYMNNKRIDEVLVKESKGKNTEKDNKKEDDWTRFLIQENDETCIDKGNNDEFIDDFDNINNFILNKIKREEIK